MCHLETLDDCDTLMDETGGFIKQTFYFTRPYATTKIRLDEFEGAKEIALSVEFIGFTNNKRLNIMDPLEGGYASTSM